MHTVFGIHVGNSSVCLAINKYDDFKCVVEVISDNTGERVMPALVIVTENEKLAGTVCKSMVVSNGNTTVSCNKLMLEQESTKNPGNGKYKILIKNNEVNYEFQLQNTTKYMTPTEVAACIYNNLYEVAKNSIHEEKISVSCVLMVPKYFSEEARFRVRTAAEAGGWNVMQIINEPAAAVLGYNLLVEKMPPPTQTVIVYRVGGRSCDATVVEISYGMITTVDTEHSQEVGGNLLISTLTKYLADEFYKKYKLDPQESHRSLMKLTLAAENCLHVLSTLESSNCFVESLCEGVDFKYSLSRARFESLLQPYLIVFAQPLRTLMLRQNLTTSNISNVLLCGGPLKIPRLKNYISDLFQESSTKVVSLPNGINYDEVLACGAARQAGVIALEKISNAVLPIEMDIPVLESLITVQIAGGECDDVKFQSGQPLPARCNVTVRGPSDKITVTFTQMKKDQARLRGQVQLECLQDPTELLLEINNEYGVNVGVPNESDCYSHYFVKMFDATAM